MKFHSLKLTVSEVHAIPLDFNLMPRNQGGLQVRSLVHRVPPLAAAMKPSAP